MFSKLVKSEIDECIQWSENCEQCLGLGKDTRCGWCKDTKQCYVANKAGTGPLNRTCAVFTFKFDMTCHLESQESLPMGARIGLAVFACVVGIVTAVYWICIFPYCTNQKKPDQNQQQDEDDE